MTVGREGLRTVGDLHIAHRPGGPDNVSPHSGECHRRARLGEADQPVKLLVYWTITGWFAMTSAAMSAGAAFMSRLTGPTVQVDAPRVGGAVIWETKSCATDALVALLGSSFLIVSTASGAGAAVAGRAAITLTMSWLGTSVFLTRVPAAA